MSHSQPNDYDPGHGARLVGGRRFSERSVISGGALTWVGHPRWVEQRFTAAIKDVLRAALAADIFLTTETRLLTSAGERAPNED